MGALDALAAASGGLYLLTMTALGVRLLLLARRNGAWPECWLGIAFLAGGSLGASAEVIASRYLHAAHPQAAGILLAFGKVAAGGGLTVYNYFVWRVFRPGERWAGRLFAVLAAATLVAIAGLAATGAFGPGLARGGGWFWLELAARLASPIWLAAESLRFYGQMRRRVELGLADALVADRFRLWSIGALAGLAMLLCSVTPLFVGPDSPVQKLNIIVLASAGLVACVAYWLAFFPTAGYRSWIRRAAVA
jgi:hypothetical protein